MRSNVRMNCIPAFELVKMPVPGERCGTVSCLTSAYAAFFRRAARVFWVDFSDFGLSCVC